MLHKTRPLPSLFLSLALLFGGMQTLSAAPRSDVDAVAKAIEANYYDPARASRIATDLRAAADRGEFDGYQDNRELAAALTGRLRPLDAHFNVRWSAAAPEADAGPQRRRPGAARAASAGIRSVEIQPGNIGYIDLRQFAHFDFHQPDQPARQAIEAALRLVSGTDAVIIDLRANGGGSPAMVGYLVSAFTPRGADIYNTFHTREGTSSEAPGDWYARPRLDVPLFVLISGRTGSAAEAFAYTLKNAGRARIVGQASGGAANPGDEIAVGNGFTVFVSTGTPTSPVTHANWEGSGVAPDVTVASELALTTTRELALQAILAGPAATGATEARWALEALRAEASPPKAGALSDYTGMFGPWRVDQDKDQLRVRQGRRPADSLLPLGGDLFTIASDPGLRLNFQRDAQGTVTALETASHDGRSGRYRRSDSAAP